MSELQKLTVSERALQQRVARKLGLAGKQLITRAGRYLVADRSTGRVESEHFDIAKLARETGCVKPWEQTA